LDEETRDEGVIAFGGTVRSRADLSDERVRGMKDHVRNKSVLR
jgi:hypothetical protein